VRELQGAGAARNADYFVHDNVRYGRQALRYLFTGGATAVVDIGGFAMLSHVRMPVVPAAACSFLVALFVNFLLTSRWVFQAPVTSQRFALFAVAACLGAVVNVTTTSAWVIYAGLPWTVAKTIAVSLTFLLNFWINARFVFRRAGRSPAAAGARD
jgi:putative flippase GtrA